MKRFVNLNEMKENDMASNDRNDDLTVQEANDLVKRYSSVTVGARSAFDDVRITTDGEFQYDVDGETYSVPVEYVRRIQVK
jgi:hypothetical protein